LPCARTCVCQRNRKAVCSSTSGFSGISPG
jgi:hypothetical protein